MSTKKTKKISAASENAVILAELTRLGMSHDGYIDPEVVVDAAAHPDNPMHRHFCWDDTEAARRYRLVQAGSLIRRVTISVVRKNGGDPVFRKVRAIQSPLIDRGVDGGSYQRVENAMKDPVRRKSLLKATLVELRGIAARRRELEELAGVWDAIDSAASILDEYEIEE